MKILLAMAVIGHILCGVTDCLLSYTPSGRMDFKQIKDPEKMSEMFADMPAGFPLASMILGTIAITLFSFGYFGLALWMERFSHVFAVILFVSAVIFVVPIVTHHVLCGAVEWFYIKLGRTSEARNVVLGFQKDTIITMFLGYAGLLGFAVALLIPIAMGITELPRWACVFNTMVAMIILSPTKLPAKGNIAGVAMFLGLLVMFML